MRESKSISIAMVGVVGGLLSMTPIVLAKDRDDTPRGKAAYVTFVKIDFPGAPSTAALGINSAGEIVGRFPAKGNTAGTRGFLRNGLGQFTPIDFPNPNAVFTVAAGINSGGDIVGQYRLSNQDPNVRHGFLRTRDGTFITIDPPDSYFTNALGINRRGEIVGRFCTGPVPTGNMACQGNPHHGFLLRGAAFTTIDFPSPPNLTTAPGMVRTDAWGINDRGEIVGGHQSIDGKSHVFRLREGQFTTIDFPGAFDTAPDGTKGGINSRGDIVSYYCDAIACGTGPTDDQHGFLLSHGEFTTTMNFPAITVGSSSGRDTANFGINARGDIVGIFDDASGTHGFLLKLENSEEDED